VRLLFVREHREVVAVPAGDDVKAESASGNHVDRRGLLGHHHRVKERHMAGGQNLHALGNGGDGRSPGEGLQHAVGFALGKGDLFPLRERKRAMAETLSHVTLCASAARVCVVPRCTSEKNTASFSRLGLLRTAPRMSGSV
jgi:hypothetical protein